MDVNIKMCQLKECFLESKRMSRKIVGEMKNPILEYPINKKNCLPKVEKSPKFSASNSSSYCFSVDCEPIKLI